MYTKLRKNVRVGASFWSVLSFWWLKDIFVIGNQRPITLEDLYSPLPEDRSDVLTNRLERHWRGELKRNKANPSLARAILKTFMKEYAFTGLITIFNDFVVRLLNPLLLQTVLRYFRHDSVDVSFERAFYSATGIVFLSLCGLLSYNHITYIGCHNGGKLRTAVCGLLYRKTLRLSKMSLDRGMSPGHVINLMSNDVGRFDMVSVFINWIWSAPLLTIAIAWILYERVGWPPLIGVGIILIVVPLQCYLGMLASRIQYRTAKATDERLALVVELIAGFQLIKMYAWEKWIRMKILSVREKELRMIRNSAFIRGIYMTMSVFVTRLMVFCTLLALATSHLTESTLTTANVFMISAYYSVIGHAIGQMFVRGITELAAVSVSINRFEKYLNIDEIGRDTKMSRGTEAEPGIEIVEATSYWRRQTTMVDSKTMLLYTNNPPTLNRINFKCDINTRLVGIVGPVGSGKTSFLETIMGELSVEKRGRVSVTGRISYASQESWIFNGSIKDNIVFDEPWDESRYESALEKCALREDLKQLMDKDDTIIGERGTSLSGGQRARVNLARAVYRKADIYLFDDPLSAVDSQVGRYLFDDIIGREGFLRDSIRILVTHQVEYLKHVDWMVALNNGAIEVQGRPSDILKGDCDLRKYEPTSMVRKEPVPSEHLKETKLDLESVAESSESVLKQYLKHGGSSLLLSLICALFIATQCLCSGSDALVADWIRLANNYENKSISYATTSETAGLQYRRQFVVTGGLLLAAVLFMGIVRTFVFQCNSTKTSAQIHKEMLDGFLQAPIRFTEANPSGRILNKFSRDLGAMDVQLPKLMLDALQMLLIICGALLVVLIVNPIFLIPLLMLILLFKAVRRVYLKSSKHLKRLDAITRSPLFTHVSNTLSGLPVIRSARAEKRMIQQFDSLQDLHTASWFIFQSTTIAFCQVLDLFAVIFITFILIYFLLFPSAVAEEKIGLVISQSMVMSGLLSWGMRQSAAVSNALVSVERVLEYVSLPKEQQRQPISLGSVWPKCGEIEFINKVGIVGRTGAGKSSLISALFHLLPVEGSILIDGVDTKNIPLEILRQRLSIIPQDPMLFHGTVRSNLDPFNAFPEQAITTVLADVDMAHLSPNTPVDENGKNFSVGQKQLLCLARAILRKNKILILDEATANVDAITDEKIQNTIRTRFWECTVIAIAHRVNTVLDSDIIIVIDQGKICDSGPPDEILPKIPNFAIS